MGVVERVKETQSFVEESWTELQKVTWPDRDQLRNATVVVIVFCVAVSAVIFTMDRIVGWVINLIMRLFGA